MLNKLPDLLNKNFAIGYLIPSVILFVGTRAIFLYNTDSGSQPLNLLKHLNEGSALASTTLIVLLSWMGGILLLGINRDLIRLLEGYGKFNPFKLLSLIERERYRRLNKRRTELENALNRVRSSGEGIDLGLRDEHMGIALTLASRYPDKSELLLPTSFGNIIRSFEVYPRVMYGIDSIPGWPRLYAVIPKEYRQALEDAKAVVDFWINLLLTSVLLISAHLLSLAYSKNFSIFSLIVLAVLIFAAFTSYNRSTSAALGWGNLVRSSFDLFLDDLRVKLGYSKPLNYRRRREMWSSFSRSVLYVNPEELPR